MLHFVNDFVGASNPHTITEFPPVIYKYNSNGHRTKEVESLDFDNYILFGGCSHTEGLGLELEEIYTHQTSNQLNLDYYNIGIGGSGLDVMFYNIMTWLAKYNHKPKIIVLQWSFPLRYSRFHDDRNPLHIQPEGSWSKDQYADFLITGERIGYFPLRTKFYYNLLNQLNIPIVNISFPDYGNKILPNYINFVEYDKARDNMHLGPISHYKLSIDIINYIQKNNLLV